MKRERQRARADHREREVHELRPGREGPNGGSPRAARQEQRRRHPAAREHQRADADYDDEDVVRVERLALQPGGEQDVGQHQRADDSPRSDVPRRAVSVGQTASARRRRRRRRARHRTRRPARPRWRGKSRSLKTTKKAKSADSAPKIGPDASKTAAARPSLKSIALGPASRHRPRARRTPPRSPVPRGARPWTPPGASDPVRGPETHCGHCLQVSSGAASPVKGAASAGDRSRPHPTPRDPMSAATRLSPRAGARTEGPLRGPPARSPPSSSAREARAPTAQRRRYRSRCGD